MGMKETKSELKKVIWPSRKDVAFGTAAVVAISAIVGAFIFLADTASLYAVDFIMDIDDLDIGFIQTIDKHQDLWGQGLSEPLVAIENITIARPDVHVQGKNLDSIAFTVNDIKYVLFKLDESDELLNWASAWEDDGKEMTINVVARVSLNEYKGIYTPQCMIEEYTIQN